MREDRADSLAELREDRASFREEVGEELSGMREELASVRGEVGEDRIGETFDRVRRDVTRALWIWCAVLILYITALIFLALHLIG